MRLLAEFILRGRAQAVAVAILGVVLFIPLLSHATIALVALRQGYRNGVLVLVAVLACHIALTLSGLSGSSHQIYAIGAPLVAFVGALVLRATVSLPLAVLAIALAGSLVGTAIVLTKPALVGELTQATQGLLENIAEQGGQEDGAEASRQLQALIGDFTPVKAAGLFALFIVWTASISLFFARWLQAMVFNPGGFQSEFHHFRLNGKLTLGCLLGSLALELLGFDYAFWASVCLTPVVMTGLGVAHFAFKRFGLGYPAVVAFYGLLVLAPPLVLLLTVVLGVLDIWLNFRIRFHLKQ